MIERQRKEQAERDTREAEERRRAAWEVKNAEEQAILRKKYLKRAWIIAMVSYVLSVGVAFVLAHDMVAFLSGGQFAKIDSWILKTEVKGFVGIFCTIIAVIVTIALIIGPIAGIIFAVKNRREPICLIVLWVWIWLIVFMLIIFSSANGFTTGQAISEVLKQCFPKKNK